MTGPSGSNPEGRRLKVSDLADISSDRDRYVDFLRAFSVLAVVFGHWLGATVSWKGDVLTANNALDLITGLWVATWFLQVMPIFFFVGGFSNYVTLQGLQRLGESSWTFLRGRASRLLRPTAVFLLFWVVVGPLAIRLRGLPDDVRSKALPVLIGPLWFLGVYLVLVAASPIMIRIHTRYRLVGLVALGLAAVTVDVVRFAFGIDWVGNLNLLFVWLFIHQLGFFYADGTFSRAPRKLIWGITVVGFGMMLGLTRLAVYPSSMVGCCGDAVSNMAPPTLAIMALGFGQIGLVMLLRPAMTRWLSRKGPWKAVIALNGSIMTLYLWHLSALVITVATLFPLGFPQPEVGSGFWWLTRPLWLAAMALPLAGLVSLFGRFERPDLDPAERYWNLTEFYAL